MTKSWDDVREDVCRLYYVEGKSLSQVEGILSRERNFQASTRAYRMKLKEWKLKKLHKGIKEVQDSAILRQSHSSLLSETSPEIDCASRQRSLIRFHEGQPTPGVSVPVHLTLNKAEPGKSGSDIPAQYKTYGMEHFSVGTNIILHRVARNPFSIADELYVQHIIAFMDYHEISIDIRNRDRMTALEVAIRSDNVAMVRMLLDGGASVHTKNDEGKQPLHGALESDISNKTDVVNLLLHRGADAKALVVSNNGESSITPVQLFLNHMAQCTDESKKRGDYEVLHACLNRAYTSASPIINSFGQDIEFMSENGSALRKFLRSWRGPIQLRDSGCDPQQSDMNTSVSCLHWLLHKGFDPFVQESGGYFCPAWQCKDFASFAFFHAAESTCANLIINNAPPRYAWKLVKMLLEPCRSRASVKDFPLSEYLRRLLAKYSLPPSQRDILPTFLRSCLGQADGMAELLRVVLRYSDLDIHRLELECGARTLRYLAYISEPLKWQLAEMLLSAEALAAPFTLSSVYTLEEYERHLRHYLVGECSHELISFCTQECGTCPPDRPHIEYQIVELRRCVLHVLTKLTADGKILASRSCTKAEQLRDILLLRRRFKLPDIPIGNLAILEMIEEGYNVESSGPGLDGLETASAL